MILKENFDIYFINNLAKQYFDRKDFHSALNLIKDTKLPNELIPNLAKCYYYTNDAYKAIELLEPLEKTHNLLLDLALFYNAVGLHNKAFEIYKNLDHMDPRVKFNIGWHYLRNGEFEKGFEHIQFGNQCRVWGNEYLYLEKRILNINKRWDGKNTEHLVLILEGGLGDQIIFLRWANYLKTKCEKLTIICNQSLIRLFTNSGYNCELPNALNYLEYTQYCPGMITPVLAKIKSPIEHVNFPYIKSFGEPYIQKQIDIIAKGKRKIGVKFYGNQEFEHDQFRSPPREALEGLSKFGQLFSLQLEEEETIIPNCKNVIKDWQDTYSVFCALDLLVTSCTSTAHLAGAMGIPTIVLVPLVPYFIWADKGASWYNSNLKVIRQTKYNDWSDAIERLYDEVSRI